MCGGNSASRGSGGSLPESDEKQGPTANILYPAKLSFRIEGQIKSFPDKVKLKEFIIKSVLYEMFKGLI